MNYSHIYSLILTILATSFTASFAHAETWQTDAFGVYQGDDHLRKTWSGLHETCTPPKNACVPEQVYPDDLASLELFVGLKSSVAGEDVLMAVSLLHDKYGNLVHEPKTLNFHFQSGQINEPAISFMGRAYKTINVPQQAGRFTAHANSSDISSIKQFYRIAADMSSLSIILPKSKFKLFENEVAHIESFDARDRYGNYPAIGIQTQAILTSKANTHIFVPILSTGEKFRTEFYAPPTQGAANGTMTLGSRETADVEFNVEALQLNPAVNLAGISFFDDGIVEILISNIGDTSGALLADGTKFNLELVTEKETRNLGTTFLLDGKIHMIYAMAENAYPVKIKGESHFGTFELEITGQEELAMPIVKNEQRS